MHTRVKTTTKSFSPKFIHMNSQQIRRQLHH